MRALIRYITRKSRGETAIRESVAEGEPLIVGRGNDCGVHLPDPRILLHHAEFTNRSGVLHVTAVGGGDLRVSGNLTESSRLLAGQKVQIGPYDIMVQEPAAGHDVVLAVEMVRPLGNDLEQLIARSRIDMSRIGLTMRGWSYAMMAVMLLLTLAAPLVLSHILPSSAGLKVLDPTAARPGASATAVWTSGPISSPHKFFGDACEICHQAAFRKVADSGCLGCHGGIRYHADPTSFPEAAFSDSKCRDCHKEHRGDLLTSAREGRFCASCHGDINQQGQKTSLHNVSDFAGDHPEFRPTVVIDPMTGRVDRSRLITETPAPQQNIGLKFPHNAHLSAAGVRDANGAMSKLECASCHAPDQAGKGMRPVSFERDCHGCHQLKFDARVPERELMHVKTDDLFKQVQDVYDALAMRGGYEEPEAPAVVRRRPGTPLSAAEKQIVGDWAAAKAAEVLGGRFGKGLCGECHAIVDKAPETATGGATWTVTPVILSAPVYPRSKFDHAKHQSTACAACHQAGQSVSISDVLMPGVAVCRSCHGNEAATDRVPSTCTQCHSFHPQDALQTPHGNARGLPPHHKATEVTK